jgi:hypothetical protein
MYTAKIYLYIKRYVSPKRCCAAYFLWGRKFRKKYTLYRPPSGRNYCTYAIRCAVLGRNFEKNTQCIALPLGTGTELYAIRCAVLGRNFRKKYTVYRPPSRDWDGTIRHQVCRVGTEFSKKIHSVSPSLRP